VANNRLPALCSRMMLPSGYGTPPPGHPENVWRCLTCTSKHVQRTAPIVQLPRLSTKEEQLHMATRPPHLPSLLASHSTVMCPPPPSLSST
jgi:hypothetical protein